MKILEFCTARTLSIMFACLIAFLVLIMVLSTDQTPRLRLIGEFSKAMIQPQSSSLSPADMEDNLPPNPAMDKDKFLGGLIAPGFDEGSCISRYQSALYRKTSPHKPSPYLVSKLRDYEDLHRRCGPYTKLYNLTLEQLKDGRSGVSPTGCNYVVWVDSAGLGNKILSLASTFLYALLTDRVFLMEQKQDMTNLFCEPFLNSSWILPSDFPIRLSQMRSNKHGNCYGWMLRGNMVNTSSAEWPPSFLYIHLLHDYSYHDKRFFCDEHQMPLSNVPWLIMKSNLYYIPPLFAIRSFQKELDKLFPNKETVFHHLGRYLLHPSNQVWGIITRFYLAYLARADEIVGIQIRVFEKGAHPLPYVMDQIQSCTVKEKILPALDPNDTVASSFYNKSKAVLVASLYSSYYDHMRSLYLSQPTVSMEVVGFHQSSHDERQLFGNRMQNMMAWSEMYMLSMCDVLVTTSWSTFGYVANSLGGLRPWILNKPENRTTPNPPCQRVRSMEPCMHAPPHLKCRVRAQNNNVDVGKFLRSCEEGYGMKLYDGN